ncbi:uncharacterized protein LOC128884165 isoform X2 [Hylaeus volcanicus]|uniref:uncharacterized protein LOC128884165 isoform X2 n=1 Tax=Hylaeus volcanicus TaxID=313075 RepID=UPI0023B78613|nr:uncharacterized protein LOC128884165 isoform X2 [Hylaeus volcanicus]
MLTVDKVQLATMDQFPQKIDALLHRIQAVKEKALDIHDEQSCFSNLKSDENEQNSKVQTSSDHKELSVLAYQEDNRLDHLLDNELNKLRRFHPLQFPVREWHRATSRVWDLIIKGSQQPFIASYPTTQKGLQQTRSKISEYVTTLRAALREIQYEQLRIIKKIVRKNEQLSTYDSFFKHKAEVPENFELLQEECKKLTKLLHLTKELVSEKNDALEDAMSIIKQLQSVQSSDQKKEHESQQVLTMQQWENEFHQLKENYSQSQNQLNEAFEEKKYLVDRLRNMEKALVLSKTQCLEWQQDSSKKHKIIVGLESLLEKAGKTLEEFEISDKENKLCMKRLSEQVGMLNRQKGTHCLKRIPVQSISVKKKKVPLTQSLTFLIAQHHTIHSKKERSFVTLASLFELKKTYTRLLTSPIFVHIPKTTLNVSTLSQAPNMLTKAVQTLTNSKYESRVKLTQCPSLKVNVTSSLQYPISLLKTIQKSTPIQRVPNQQCIRNFCRTTVQLVERPSYPLVFTRHFFLQIMIQASKGGTKDSDMSQTQSNPFDDSKINQDFFLSQSIGIIHPNGLHDSSSFSKRNHSISTCELSEDVSCVSGTLTSNYSPLRNTLPFPHIRFVQNPSPRLSSSTPTIKIMQNQKNILSVQEKRQAFERRSTCTVLSPLSFSQQKNPFTKLSKKVIGSFSELSLSPKRRNKFSKIIKKKKSHPIRKSCRHLKEPLFFNPHYVHIKQMYLRKFRKYCVLIQKLTFQTQQTKSPSRRYFKLENEKVQQSNHGMVVREKSCTFSPTQLQLLFHTKPVLNQVIGTKTDRLKQKISLKKPVLKRNSDILKEKRIKLDSSTKDNVKYISTIGKFLTPSQNSPSTLIRVHNQFSQVLVLNYQLNPCFTSAQTAVDDTFFNEYKEKLEKEYNAKLHKQCALLEKVVKKRSNLLEHQSNLEIQNWKEKYSNREKECYLLQVAIQKLLQKKEFKNYTLEQPFLSMKTFLRTPRENNTCASHKAYHENPTSFYSPLTSLHSLKHKESVDTMDCMSAVLSIERNIPCPNKISGLHDNKRMFENTSCVEQENIKNHTHTTDQETFQLYVPQVLKNPLEISALPESNIFLPENVALHPADTPYQRIAGEEIENDLLRNLCRVRQNVSKTFFASPILN